MSTAITGQDAAGLTSAVLRSLSNSPGGKTAEAAASQASSRQVFQAAGDSAEFFDHLCAHYRETRRSAAEIPCDATVRLADGTVFDSGACVVKNVSPSGALLGGLKLSKGCLPVQGFKLVLVLRGQEYAGISIEALPVRFAPEAGGLGVKFQEIFVTV